MSSEFTDLLHRLMNVRLKGEGSSPELDAVSEFEDFSDKVAPGETLDSCDRAILFDAP